MSVGTQRRITSTSCNSKAQEATRVSKPPLRSHATIAHKSHKSPSSPSLTIFDQIKHIESHWEEGALLLANLCCCYRFLPSISYRRRIGRRGILTKDRKLLSSLSVFSCFVLRIPSPKMSQASFRLSFS